MQPLEEEPQYQAFPFYPIDPVEESDDYMDSEAKQVLNKHKFQPPCILEDLEGFPMTDEMYASQQNWEIIRKQLIAKQQEFLTKFKFLEDTLKKESGEMFKLFNRFQAKIESFSLRNQPMKEEKEVVECLQKLIKTS
mmetsp:Transcript_16812/g.25900  ORF Transcript_16812/g.25900 Transcript_16812/m.25900 type:complete len:137 (+) Transcript_16812:232-642(+)